MFFMAHVYILHSGILDKYYIGSTEDEINERLRRHLSNHAGFTARAKDWEVVYFEYYSEKKMAIAREKQIKAWKSKVRILELIHKSKG